MTSPRPLPKKKPEPKDYGKVIHSWMPGGSVSWDPSLSSYEQARAEAAYCAEMALRGRETVDAGNGETIVFRHLSRSKRWCVAGRLPHSPFQVLQDEALELGCELGLELDGTWFKFWFKDRSREVYDVVEISDLDAGMKRARRWLDMEKDNQKARSHSGCEICLPCSCGANPPCRGNCPANAAPEGEDLSACGVCGEPSAPGGSGLCYKDECADYLPQESP